MNWFPNFQDSQHRQSLLITIFFTYYQQWERNLWNAFDKPRLCRCRILDICGPYCFHFEKEKKQFQAEVDTFRGITEFDSSASKEGSLNFPIGVPKARPRNLKSRTIVYFTKNICCYQVGSSPRKQFPINFVFTKLVTCLPCCPTILN